MINSPEFGPVLVEQELGRSSDSNSLSCGSPTQHSSRSSFQMTAQGNTSPRSGITRLDSILDMQGKKSMSNGSGPSIRSGVSFKNNASFQRNGQGMEEHPKNIYRSTSPRSMRLDQILGNKNDGAIHRGISIRGGSMGSSSTNMLNSPRNKSMSGNSFQFKNNNAYGSSSALPYPQQSSQLQPQLQGSHVPSFRIGEGVTIQGPSSSFAMKPSSLTSSPSTQPSFIRSSLSSNGLRSPRAASNRIQTLVAFSEELMSKFGSLDVADRCRVGQRLRADVIAHFQDVYKIPSEDILISFELTDAMQLQAMFEVPASVEARARSIILFRAKVPVQAVTMIEELKKL